jgi:hypothetical protein
MLGTLPPVRCVLPMPSNTPLRASPGFGRGYSFSHREGLSLHPRRQAAVRARPVHSTGQGFAQQAEYFVCRDLELCRDLLNVLVAECGTKLRRTTRGACRPARPRRNATQSTRRTRCRCAVAISERGDAHHRQCDRDHRRRDRHAGRNEAGRVRLKGSAGTLHAGSAAADAAIVTCKKAF